MDDISFSINHDKIQCYKFYLTPIYPNHNEGDGRKNGFQQSDSECKRYGGHTLFL